MADISTELARILSAIYGEDVRGSIHDAIEKINDVSEVVLTTGTAVTGPSSSSTGFYDDSLYLNTDTFELWKCTGVNTWASQGILKGEAGDDGNGIVSITKTATSGLVDTYTITYTDGNTSTFNVTNGEDGDNGNRWYRGTAVSGKAVLPTVYPTGIADANANDFYLNPSEGAIYHCVTGGNDQTATWSYDFTMTGGGGGGSIVTWTQIQSSGTKIAEIDIDGSTQDVYAPTGGGGAAWGSISGTLSDQTDLQNALNAKANSASLAAVATSGSYNDLTDLPTIPTVNDGQLTIQQNGTNKATFTANQSGNATANIVTDDWVATGTVSNGAVSFSGIDDTGNYAYKPFAEITSSSTNKNPSAQISTLSGTGTSSMSVTYTTDADNGTTVKLRRIK